MSTLRSSTLIAGLAATLPLAAASVAMLSAQQSAPAYKDAKRPVAERVADLLGRMTLEEKVAQLTTRWTTPSALQERRRHVRSRRAPRDAAPPGPRPSLRARARSAGPPAGPARPHARQHAEFVNARPELAAREHPARHSR